MADALRGTMDAAEYKHVVLGLIFFKYLSDAIEERGEAVLAEWREDAAEDRDEYVAENIFWVAAEARWTHLREQARQPTVGLTVDQAMAATELDNPALKDVLPQDYARQALDNWRLAKMNLAIRGIEGQIAHGDRFHCDRQPDLKAPFILANPPFNVSDWGATSDGVGRGHPATAQAGRRQSVGVQAGRVRG